MAANAAAAGRLMDKSYTEAKEILDRIAKHNMEWVDDTNDGKAGRKKRSHNVNSIDASVIATLSAQVGQIASELKNRQPGVLPSNTETPGNNDGKKQCHAVTLRSGRALEKRRMNPRNSSPLKERITRSMDQEERTLETTSHSEPSTSNAGNSEVTLNTPFPRRLMKKNDEQKFKRFLELLKQLHINIPLIEALEQMPTYVKFFKDILTKKRRVSKKEVIALTQECNALVSNSLPKKQKDLGSFPVPCSIGGLDVGHALCDLEASINLLPLSIFKKLGIGEAQPTFVTIQIADRTIKYPEGKIEDVLVKVDNLIFLADFIILDYGADREVPIIFGCPFLTTRKVLIDVHKGELTMRVDNKEVKFNVLNTLKFPNSEDCQLNSIELPEEDTYVCEVLALEENLKESEPPSLSERRTKLTRPSLEEPPELELKQLPGHLKYAFLGTNNTLPVITSQILQSLMSNLSCRC
ncbi:uncharacterized protein LOC120083133 [Benincasa hispida]|uniref:uncharacterized protein LOC120083133 n=1 Tax=Benincasa hispida TaxID=102211 RepID=UPI001900CAE1|nr:uncharacterized protein LOC120083133 [Benincasa hispida]